MSEASRSAVFGRRFGRHVWHLIRPYRRSPDAKRGALLLAQAVALELGTVWGNVLVALAWGGL